MSLTALSKFAAENNINVLGKPGKKALRSDNVAAVRDFLKERKH